MTTYKDLSAYLDELEASSVLRDRTESILQAFTALAAAPIYEVFISQEAEPPVDSYAARDKRMQVEVRTLDCEYSILTACTPPNVIRLYRIAIDLLRPNLVRR